jgi:hypothetical protein
MALEITGKIIQQLEQQSGASKTGKNWVKQDFVIETPGQYPKKVCLSAWGDATDTLANASVGDHVNISFNLESREYNGKWYTEARVWKMSIGSKEAKPKNDIPTVEAEEVEPSDLPW